MNNSHNLSRFEKHPSVLQGQTPLGRGGAGRERERERERERVRERERDLL